jgi:fatty-acid desaturase
MVGSMKSYNVAGLAIIIGYGLACMVAAPAALGPWRGLGVGAVYFLVCWFVAGVYLADVLHLGVAHRALDFKPWFIKTITVVNNLFGIYVGPTDWVNRHRLHHKHSDHEGDPNKLSDDGLWRTLYLCVFPYRCKENVATDPICRSLTFRVTSHWLFIVVSQIFNFALLSWLVGGWAFAAVMFVGLRIFAIWVNMIQNYWTHTRAFGYRRYPDERDNAMNIGEWLPVTATFSACLQNNHHHYPNLLRLSHSDSEYDFGLLTIKAMKVLGLVTATPKGAMIPADVSLSRLGF